MDLVLIRHGSRDDEKLSRRGEHQAEQLGAALTERGITPSLVLSSKRQHSLDTAGRVAGESECFPAMELTPLIPGQKPVDREGRLPGSLDAILVEARTNGVDLATHEVIAIVGHEGRLSNLLTDITGSRHRPFGHGEAVGVRADSLRDLQMGRGEVRFRYPVVDHGEADLRPKAQSKMTVSTFLAGFVFAALIELLLTRNLSTAASVAAVLLTLSLALFLAAIYIYDQLSMPEGFWTDGPRPRRFTRLQESRERKREARWRETQRSSGESAADDEQAELRLDGPLFLTMVATSRFVFTPAVCAALVGFGGILVDLESDFVPVLCGAAVLIGFGAFLFRRPDLGFD